MIVPHLLAGLTIAPIAKPLAAVLAYFYSLVPNYGIAIIMVTIAMMIVLTPLTIKQTRSMLVMQKLQPEMKKLQEQHKNDRQALNEAVMALYKEHNASPLGGCLPMLLPFPLFIALLRLLEGLSRIEHPKGGPPGGIPVPNYLTSHSRMYIDIVKAGGKLDAFGMNIAKSARNVGGGFGHTLPYFVLLILMVGTQFYQQYQLTSKNPAAMSQPGQAAMMKFIPLFFGVISINFPAGVVLYWTVSNIIRIGQQWALYRYDPKVKSLVAKDVTEIEAKTREIEAKEKAAENKPPRPSGLRGLIANASEAAADRRSQAGKNVPKPSARPGGDRAGGAGRPGTRPSTGKSAGVPPTPGKRPVAGGPGGTGKRPIPQKPAPPKGQAPKGVASKPGGAKPPAAKATPPPSKASAGAAGTGKAAPAKAAPAKAAPAKAPAAKAPPAKAPAAKASPVNPTPAHSAATPSASTESATPNEGATAANGSKGAANTTPDPATSRNAAPDRNGTSTSDADDNIPPASPGTSAAPGTPPSPAGEGNGRPAKPRTGGGSARSVGSRRRRPGR